MNFDDGGIQAHRLDANAHDLLALQLFEDLIKDPALGPAVHAGIDGVPRSEAFGQAAPLAAVLGHIEQRVQQLQVVGLYVAALAGQSGGNMLVLRFDLHVRSISQDYELVLTLPSPELLARRIRMDLGAG